jgi:hypothetical protein
VSHYDVLGVAPAADETSVRRAYVRLARLHHPDVAGGDAARMRAINEAWETLRDPVRRARYDRSLALRPAPAPRPAAERWSSADVDLDLDQRDLSDLADDRPIHAVVLPRWLSLVPVALFAVSVASFVFGTVLASQPILGFAAVALVLSLLLFLAAPFIALYASSRPGHDRDPH